MSHLEPANYWEPWIWRLFFENPGIFHQKYSRNEFSESKEVLSTSIQCKSNPIASMYAIFTYIQFKFMVHLNAGKYTAMTTSSAKKNGDHDGVWTPFKVLLPGKLLKSAIFRFNKAGKNEFPLNHWCDTCNFSGVLNLFIENGKLPTRKFSGLDFLHWEWLEKAAPISPFLA